VIWCVGSIIVCSSYSIAQLVVGRFVNGIAVGICSAQVPVYVSELAQPSKRGRVVGAQQWAITWGVSSPSLESKTSRTTPLTHLRS
jgi:MFS family permease